MDCLGTQGSFVLHCSPVTMLARIRAASIAAREKGSLKSIETSYTVLAGTNERPAFMVRVLKSIAEKKRASTMEPTASAAEAKRNPFLPYERSMYVEDLADGHVLLLNKFNVVKNHCLVVTKKFEEQSSLLSSADFVAGCKVLGEIAGVLFYNAGRIAGASQMHKHMQHVPCPLLPGSELDTPFDSGLCGGGKEVYESRQLGYVHGVVNMDDLWKEGNKGDKGDICMQRYTEMLNVLSKKIGWTGSGKPFAYNLLMTRKWMMMIPRKEECYEGISINALGFVGCLLVRDEGQLETVKRVGGMELLESVGFAA